jgi:hypothetical protein
VAHKGLSCQWWWWWWMGSHAHSVFTCKKQKAVQGLSLVCIYILNHPDISGVNSFWWSNFLLFRSEVAMYVFMLLNPVYTAWQSAIVFVVCSMSFHGNVCDITKGQFVMFCAAIWCSLLVLKHWVMFVYIDGIDFSAYFMYVVLFQCVYVFCFCICPYDVHGVCYFPYLCSLFNIWV